MKKLDVGDVAHLCELAHENSDSTLSSSTCNFDLPRIGSGEAQWRSCDVTMNGKMEASIL